MKLSDLGSKSVRACGQEITPDTSGAFRAASAVFLGLSATIRRWLWRETKPATAQQGAASCKGAALAEKKWPIQMRCWGREYLVNNDEDLRALVGHLERGEKALANRYRTGGSWPRGRHRLKPMVDYGPLWYCRDCDRRHRGSTFQCPLSKRWREDIEGRAEGASASAQTIETASSVDAVARSGGAGTDGPRASDDTAAQLLRETRY